MRSNSFSEANIFWKSAPFLKQKYIEKQLVCWGRNILKISSFSGADICWKSARFWGQKSIGKSIVFWRINILKIACFLWQNYIENQPILWGKCPFKISSFSMDFYPQWKRINFRYSSFSCNESHQLYPAHFLACKFSSFTAEFCWFSTQ